MASVTLSNVVKQYGAVKAVDDLSIAIADREFAVLVGPSGCGKTTALRMIAGLESISSGEIRIGDTVVNEMPPRDRDIAMVFQNYALYPHMSIRANMGFGLRIRKLPQREIDARVEEAADILGLTEYLDRKPKALSGGQRQRVAVGRAIVRKPRLFLFDEPLSNLDAKLRVAMRAEISKLHRRLGATIIYVTHDQVEAMTMADRIFIMSRGLLQQSGTPMEVYARPRNRFVAGFIGSPAMNFLDATLETTPAGPVLAGSAFRLAVPDAMASALGGYAGRRVAFGLRPEDIVPRDPAAPPGTSLRAQADVVETLGSEVFVHLACGTDTIVARMPAPDVPPRVGETMEVDVRMTRTHVFDAESSATIV